MLDPNIKGYNGAEDPFEARVNMGPVEPPQRKGRLPQYARHQLVELQQKLDELETLGVFRCPEDIDITVEYLNPSFLVKKPSGGYRLVTAFADVGRYSKPQPSLMQNVDSTLCHIAQWKHIIASDLTSAFYQIHLSPNFMKYCGVATPIRGVRVYAQSVMGIPDIETTLEELMCCVLCHLLEEGVPKNRRRSILWRKHTTRTPTELEEGSTSPPQVWSPPFRIEDHHQPSVHNNTGMDLECWHFKSKSTPHCHPRLVSRTRNRWPHAVIHRSIQGALLRHPWVFITSCTTWRRRSWSWI